MVTLAEIVAEGERLEARTLVAHRDYPNEPLLHGTVHIERSAFYRTHGHRLLAVVKAATYLFRALDYVTPDWRERTCIIDEYSDEVNVAWCGLELALEHEPSTPEQIERAFDAAASGADEKGGDR